MAPFYVRLVMAKVSIVIPVYNVEQYLNECLDSVKNQTLEDIEIICVDDGSTDACPAILDQYAAEDGRFKVIHKENEGYGRAMNVGMDAASAPYIAILESDDYVSEDMYETLYNTMIENDLEVLKCDFYEFYKNTKGEYIEEYKPLTENKDIIHLYETVIAVKDNEDALRYTKYTWSGLYSTNYLRKNNIRHNETPGASYQDNGFWFQTMVYAERLFFLKRAFYRYRIDNPNSSMYSKVKVYAVCDEFDFVNKILDGMGESGKQFYKWSYFRRITDCISSVHRVDDVYKLPLVLKTRDDFLKAALEGHIDRHLFGDWWNRRLYNMIVDPQSIVDEEKERVKKILSHTQNYENIILYGAGQVGIRVQNALKVCRENRKIRAYAVTDKSTNVDELKGIPVISIYDLNEYKKKSLIIISVGNKLKNEVEMLVKELGFENFIFATDIL